MPGNMDPLGQVAQILGVRKAIGVRTQEAATVEPDKPKRGDPSLVHVSHSGSALAEMAERLRAVGFVHNPNGVEQHQNRPPPHHQKSPKAKDGEVRPREAGSRGPRLKRFEESDENRAERKTRAKELSQEEVNEVRRLKDLDGKVKAHEMAHKVAAGSLAGGGPYYEYEQGPDGVNYAVAGHVPIHVPETSDPEQALRDSEKAYRAALAPTDPSAADRAAAAQFSSRAAQARQQIAKNRGDDPGGVKQGAGEKEGDRQPVTESNETRDDSKAIHAHRHPEFLLGHGLPK